MKVRHITLLDHLVEGDESVVMFGAQVVHLSAIPTAILEASTEWVDLKDLAKMLEQRFGTPEAGVGAEAATGRIVGELTQLGLIEHV